MVDDHGLPEESRPLGVFRRLRRHHARGTLYPTNDGGVFNESVVSDDLAGGGMMIVCWIWRVVCDDLLAVDVMLAVMSNYYAENLCYKTYIYIFANLLNFFMDLGKQ